MTSTGIGTEPDRIEQQIDIEATAERVWRLVSEPGWWINDGEVVPHTLERDGSLVRVHDEVHGEFLLRVVTEEPPRHVAFRWLTRGVQPDGPEETGGSTLVEFWVDERPEGGVRLRVVESGFASLDASADERRQRYADNTEGWTTELAAAARHLADRP